MMRVKLPLIFTGQTCKLHCLRIEGWGGEYKMAEEVLKAGITRKPGWLYYLDRDLDDYRAKLVRGGERKRHLKKRKQLLKLRKMVAKRKRVLPSQQLARQKPRAAPRKNQQLKRLVPEKAQLKRLLLKNL